MTPAQRSLQGDLAFGKLSEEQAYELLKQVDSEIVPSQDPMALFDFHSPKAFIELKSRSFHMANYPTTHVGTNKVRYAEEHPEKTFYFAFKFTDGLFYCKYEKALFDKFKKGKCERTDRGRSEVMEVLNIPITVLARIHPRNAQGTFTVSF